MSSIKVQLKQIIENLQQQHESSELEFKEDQTSLPDSFWETYSSFANIYPNEDGLITMQDFQQRLTDAITSDAELMGMHY